MTDNADRIKDLAFKYLNLQDEIAKNQEILVNMEQDMFMLIKELPYNAVADKIRGSIVELKISESESFNSKLFKTQNPDKYEQYRTVSKRFNQKKLKEKEPELFAQYIDRLRAEYLQIKRIKKSG